MAKSNLTVEVRFWAKVDVRGPQECWPWTGSDDGNGGYGRFKFGSVNIGAHRVAWILTNGPIPAGSGSHGTCVCHTCDRKRCCNPRHLFLGSHQDNMDDKRMKGRCVTSGIRGEAHGMAKLSESDVIEIRAARGEPLGMVAARKGVSKATVSLIQNRKLWPHIAEVSA